MKKWIFGGVLVIFVIILVGGFIYTSLKPDKLTSKQREEAISQIMGRKANTNPEIKKGNGIHEGKYATFNYPAAAKVYEYRDTELKNNSNMLESFSFDMQAPRRVFNYTVEKNSSSIGKIDDISAVNFRKNPSSGYKQENIKVGSEVGLAFAKDSSGEFMAEKSGFFLVNGNIYTISVTASTKTDAESLFKEVLSSMKFTN